MTKWDLSCMLRLSLYNYTALLNIDFWHEVLKSNRLSAFTKVPPLLLHSIFLIYNNIFYIAVEISVWNAENLVYYHVDLLTAIDVET